MRQYAFTILIGLVISSVSLTGIACSGSTDEGATEIEEQNSTSIEIMGRVESLDGSTLRLTTSEGTVNILISDDSSIQKMCESSYADITVGENISVTGRTNATGTIEAMSITITRGSMTSLFAPQIGNRPGSEFPGGFDSGNEGQEFESPQAPERPGDFEGLPGGEAISGVVQKIEGNVVTVSTSEENIDVLVSNETSIQKVCEGSISDITTDKMVTVSGSQMEEGYIEAENIFITSSFVQPQ